MSFTDPQSVTFAAPISATVSLPRIAVGTNQSVYGSADGLTRLTASSQYNGTRNRRLLRLDYSKIAADVFDSTINVEKRMACYLVFDIPKVGFTNAEQLAVYGGLKGAMTASTDALITKLLGGES